MTYSPIAVVPDSVVVIDLEALQVLDQAPLQVPAAGGLDCGIYQAVATRHAMEVVFLGP